MGAKKLSVGGKSSKAKKNAKKKKSNGTKKRGPYVPLDTGPLTQGDYSQYGYHMARQKRNKKIDGLKYYLDIKHGNKRMTNKFNWCESYAPLIREMLNKGGNAADFTYEHLKNARKNRVTGYKSYAKPRVPKTSRKRLTPEQRQEREAKKKKTGRKLKPEHLKAMQDGLAKWKALSPDDKLTWAIERHVRQGEARVKRSDRKKAAKNNTVTLKSPDGAVLAHIVSPNGQPIVAESKGAYMPKRSSKEVPVQFA